MRRNGQTRTGEEACSKTVKDETIFGSAYTPIVSQAPFPRTPCHKQIGSNSMSPLARERGLVVDCGCVMASHANVEHSAMPTMLAGESVTSFQTACLAAGFARLPPTFTNPKMTLPKSQFDKSSLGIL